VFRLQLPQPCAALRAFLFFVFGYVRVVVRSLD